MKTSNEQRLRNKAFRSQMRAAIKELHNETDKEEAVKRYRQVTSLLDKAASYGLIHKKHADRNKSRLVQLVHKLG